MPEQEGTPEREHPREWTSAPAHRIVGAHADIDVGEELPAPTS
jgi:hypothetical protein